MEEAPTKKRLLLELFSGTGSIGKAFRAQGGWEVVSVDNDPKAHEATFTQDILDFQVSQLGGRTVDLVWASPPCCNYSNARRKIKGITEVGVERQARGEGTEHRRRAWMLYFRREPLDWQAQDKAAPGPLAVAQSRLLHLRHAVQKAHGHLDRHCMET